MRFYWLIIGILSVWRVTHLLQAEDGPWKLLVRLRLAAGDGFWAKLLDCFYCLSTWISVPFALLIGEGWMEKAILWPALSAGAIMLERLTGEMTGTPAAHYHEDLEESDGMLRRSEKTDQPSRMDPPRV